jgi:hypothetical protein
MSGKADSTAQECGAALPRGLPDFQLSLLGVLDQALHLIYNE